MADVVNALSAVPLSHLLVVAVLLVMVLIGLPRMLRHLGLSKIGSVEFRKESSDSSVLQLFQLTERLQDIDSDFKVALWSMTDGLFDDIANNSDFCCSVCISHVLFSISDYVRSLILLGVTYRSLSTGEESHLLDKLRIGVTRGVRRSREIHLPDMCPVKGDLDKVSLSRYDWVVKDWVVRARSLASRFLRDRIQVTESACSVCTDPYTKSIMQGMLASDVKLCKSLSGDKK